MELTTDLHCTEDDVNIAVFHPLVGHGFLYGTKQGRLRAASKSGKEQVQAEVVTSAVQATSGSVATGGATATAHEAGSSQPATRSRFSLRGRRT
jgi:hypothetical protein